MSTAIKFGTDGWRAVIARDYTEDNLRRVALGTARWMVSKGMKSVVVGHDCRFGGSMFANLTARVLAGEGLQVRLAHDFVSTPMISLSVVELKADMGWSLPPAIIHRSTMDLN
jgi:phosphomannomutase